MWKNYNDEGQFLVNPSRASMQELGRELRALVSDKDDLWVWRAEDACHFEFARKHNLQAQAWLYIDPNKALVRVSSYSHGGDTAETAKHMRQHPKFKYFTVEGPDEPSNLDEVTDEDRKLLHELCVKVLDMKRYSAEEAVLAIGGEA
jgi:hypothetical protein